MTYTYIPYNVNDSVKVKLTKVGRDALKRQHHKFWMGIGKDREYIPPKEDADGWSDWTMWRLMEDLGHLCHLGGDVPFETEIQILFRQAPAATVDERT